ncbi:MAG: winged helix-turn-helix domain-containing protein [Nitrosopumilaceae archaeon]
MHIELRFCYDYDSYIHFKLEISKTLVARFEQTLGFISTKLFSLNATWLFFPIDFLAITKEVIFLLTWKRGFIEIVGEILLNLSNDSLKKSHVTYKCNLDARAVTKYIHLMIDIKLVERLKDVQEYKITSKGIRFLEKYEKLKRYLEPDLIPTQTLKELQLHKKKISS